MGYESTNECQCAQKYCILVVFCLTNVTFRGKKAMSVDISDKVHTVLAIATDRLVVATDCKR